MTAQYREIDLRRLTMSKYDFEMWCTARRLARTEPVDLDAVRTECWLCLSDANPDCDSDALEEATNSLATYGLGALQDHFTPWRAKEIIRNYLAVLETVAGPTLQGRGVTNTGWDDKTRGPRMSNATGRVIFKYQMPVLERFTMSLPEGAEIIRMEDQGGMFWLWAVVNTEAPNEERRFRAFKTGAKIPDGLALNYIGFCAVFVQMELGLYIFEEA